MNKIGFARLIAYLASITRHDYDTYEIGQIDMLITNSLAPTTQAPDARTVRELLEYIAAGKKIEAIKAHRVLTGDGLKESKDAIDRVMDRFVHTPAA